MLQHHEERIGEELKRLKKELRPFVEHHLRCHYGASWEAEMRKSLLERYQASKVLHLDTQALLRIMLDHWDEIFCQVLEPKARRIIDEVRIARNKWAHEETFTDIEAQSALDNIHYLLTCITSPKYKDASAFSEAHKRNPGNDFPQMHAVVCADCGVRIQVPFLPANGQPVYCSSCSAKIRGNRQSIRQGDVVEGVIVHIDQNAILVDIGLKSEGVLSPKELPTVGDWSFKNLHLNDKVLAFVIQPETPNGPAILSLTRSNATFDYKNKASQSSTQPHLGGEYTTREEKPSQSSTRPHRDTAYEYVVVHCYRCGVGIRVPFSTANSNQRLYCRACRPSIPPVRPGVPRLVLDRSNFFRSRPLGISIVSILVFIEGVLEIIGGFLLSFLFHGLIYLIVGSVSLILAWGLWRLKRWAFWTAIVLETINVIANFISLIQGNGSPIVGLIIAVAIIAYMLCNQNVRAAFWYGI